MSKRLLRGEDITEGELDLHKLTRAWMKPQRTRKLQHNTYYFSIWKVVSWFSITVMRLRLPSPFSCFSVFSIEHSKPQSVLVSFTCLKVSLCSHSNVHILPWRILLNVIIFRFLLKLSNCFLPQLEEVPRRMEFSIPLWTFFFMSLLSFFFLIYFSLRWKDLILVEMPKQMYDFIKLHFIRWFHITLPK